MSISTHFLDGGQEPDQAPPPEGNHGQIELIRVPGRTSLDYDPGHDPLLFELIRPLDDLEDQLLNDFAGHALTMSEVYEEHSVGKPFLKNNCKQALWNLCERGSLGTSRKPRKITFADDISASSRTLHSLRPHDQGPHPQHRRGRRAPRFRLM